MWLYLLQTVGKRSGDIANLLKYVQQQAAYQNLPQDKQDFITRMLTAAENDTVTDFIAVEGYAAVLELIDGKVTQCMFEGIPRDTWRFMSYTPVHLQPNINDSNTFVTMKTG